MSRQKKRKETLALRKLYKKIPNCHCKGLCFETCGVVIFSNSEMERVKEKAEWKEYEFGFIPISNEGLTCAFLKDSRCSIYEDRPFFCRIYGASQKLKCEFGCKPTLNREKELEISKKYFNIIDTTM